MKNSKIECSMLNKTAYIEYSLYMNNIEVKFESDQNITK